MHLSGAGPLAVSYLSELGAYLQEGVPSSFLEVVVPSSFLGVVVPCAWQEVKEGRRLSLEAEVVEGGSRPWQSSHGKAGDAMK